MKVKSSVASLLRSSFQLFFLKKPEPKRNCKNKRFDISRYNHVIAGSVVLVLIGRRVKIEKNISSQVDKRAI